MTNKILIVGPAWVGDMIMAQTLFQLLHQQQSNTELHVLAPQWSLPLLARMPEVTRAIVSPFSHGELLLRKRYRFAKALREEQCQQAIVLPNSFKSALIPFWAKIPVRTGWLGEQRYGLLNDVRYLDETLFPKMIQRFAALAYPAHAILPATLPFPALQCDETQMHLTLKKYQLSIEKPVLALCPGAEFGSSKRWPENHHAIVANQKLSEGWSVWLLGSQNDYAIAEDIQNKTQSRCVNLAGKTSLLEAVDLLSVATVVVANDSGLMHIAAALNRPVVAVYGSTSSDFTPPLSTKAHVLQVELACRPCFKRTCPLVHQDCMRLVTPESVLLAISSSKTFSGNYCVQ